MRAWLLALAFGGCAQLEPPPEAPASRLPQRCDYQVSLDEAGVLAVRAECDVALTSMIASEAAMADRIELTTLAGEPIQRNGPEFDLPPGTRGARYRIDLDAVAHDNADIDVAYRVSAGESSTRTAWLTAVSTWLLRPRPLAPDTRVAVSVETPRYVRFATAMARPRERRGPAGARATHYELSGRELRNATYAAFGSFDRELLELPAPPGASAPAWLELVTLPGSFSTTAAERREWIESVARAVATFWHGFPVARALLVVVPVPGAKITRGKVVATGGAGVALLMGEEMSRRDLGDDWILVHELFHLGVPSFAREGEWLDEGLATYYEPIIRARAGFRDADWAWRELSSELEYGGAAIEQVGLAASEGAALYWGGAYVALMADVATRQRSGGRLGLEDGLRAVLARGGNATQVWTLDRVIATVDERLGGDTLGKLAERHRRPGQRPPLEQLWKDLGLLSNGTVIDEDAPLAAVRRAVVHPP